MLHQISKIFVILFAVFTFTVLDSNGVDAQVIRNTGDCNNINLRSDVSNRTTINPLAIVCPIIKTFNAMLLLAGAVFVGMVFYASYQYSTATGDPKAAAGAKNTLTYAILGFVAILATFTIMNIVGGVFGISSNVQGFGPFNSFIEAINELMCNLQNIRGVCN